MTQFLVLTPDQLQEFVETVALRVESIIKDSQKKEINSKEWLTSKEVCELLKISHTTQNEWSKNGLLTKHKVGNRARFRYDQVLEAFTIVESKRAKR